jgi:hypothetical protein
MCGRSHRLVTIDCYSLPSLSLAGPTWTRSSTVKFRNSLATGVRIDLIVRGACALRPAVAGAWRTQQGDGIWT